MAIKIFFLLLLPHFSLPGFFRRFGRGEAQFVGEKPAEHTHTEQFLRRHQNTREDAKNKSQIEKERRKEECETDVRKGIRFSFCLLLFLFRLSLSLSHIFSFSFSLSLSLSVCTSLRFFIKYSFKNVSSSSSYCNGPYCRCCFLAYLYGF